MDADHGIGSRSLRLLGQSAEGKLGGVVHGLGHDLHLARVAVDRETPILPADMVDRAARDLGQRLEPALTRQEELVDREIGGEEALPVAYVVQTTLGREGDAS